MLLVRKPDCIRNENKTLGENGNASTLHITSNSDSMYLPRHSSIPRRNTVVVGNTKDEDVAGGGGRGLVMGQVPKNWVVCYIPKINLRNELKAN